MAVGFRRSQKARSRIANRPKGNGIMPTVYLREETKRRLYEFIRKSRISPAFGSPNKFKTPNEAIEFLLKIGLKFSIESLETVAKQPSVMGKMRVSELDDPEKKKEVVEKRFEEEEERE